MARASGFDRAKIIDEICERVSNGESLRSLCRQDHFPSWKTVYDWLGDDPEFATRFARARELGADAIAEGILDIIDEPPARIESEHGDRVDAGYVQWQKNRAEQRLKLLAKWQPKKYGDKIGVEHSGHIEQLTDEQIEAKIAALSAQAGDGSA